MPFPRTFPSEAASTIGRAILARDLDEHLLEPAYDVAGYGCYQLGFAADETIPPAPTAVGPHAELDEASAARMLIDAAEGEGRFGSSYGEDAAKAIPWSVIVPIVYDLIKKLLEKRKPK